MLTPELPDMFNHLKPKRKLAFRCSPDSIFQLYHFRVLVAKLFPVSWTAHDTGVMDQRLLAFSQPIPVLLQSEHIGK